jgi:CxxC motif-containing protein (DUF1111 family)
MTRRSWCAVAAAALLWGVGCRDESLSPGSGVETPLPADEFTLEEMAEKAVLNGSSGAFGDPLPGLPPHLLARFEAGKDDFEEIETTDEGLGPVFNATGCAECHDQGGVGGAGTGIETRFGRIGPDGRFDPMLEHGGSLLQSAGIEYADCVQPPEAVPAEANIVAGRQTTSVFGLGLLEAIPDHVLRRLADPNDRDRDGISGRLHWVRSPASGRFEIGRFGWKAQVPSTLVFSGDAYLNEMGITNSLFPHESVPQGGAYVCDDGLTGDEFEDEDTDGDGISEGVELFTDFMRLLGPPPLNGRPTEAVVRGARLFARADCAGCHQPAFMSGFVRDMPALSLRRFYPFTDLLLHDMGSLGDGIEQGQALGSEMRTAPLWGLRESGPYLHDGRATTIEDAIRAHDGEAARSRDAFLRLSPEQRSDLLAFLGFI